MTSSSIKEIKDQFIEVVTKALSHKWYIIITLVIGFWSQLYSRGFIPEYFERTKQETRAENSQNWK